MGFSHGRQTSLSRYACASRSPRHVRAINGRTLYGHASLHKLPPIASVPHYLSLPPFLPPHLPYFQLAFLPPIFFFLRLLTQSTPKVTTREREHFSRQEAVKRKTSKLTSVVIIFTVDGVKWPRRLSETWGRKLLRNCFLPHIARSRLVQLRPRQSFVARTRGRNARQ